MSSARPAPRVQTPRGGPVHAEIVAVGRDLLRGRVRDTNAMMVATDLTRRGAVVHRITFVDDRDRAITESITEAFARGAGLVVTTGGLGPTSDDRTLGAVADALGVPLELHPHAREMVESALTRLRSSGQVVHGRITKAREKMCAIPIGSEPLENKIGISPGVLATLAGGATVVCLPGVPAEAEAVWADVPERIRGIEKPQAHAAREVEAPTADDSVLQPLLERLRGEHPAVWITTQSPGFARARKSRRGSIIALEASAPSQREAELLVDAAVQRLLGLAGAG